MGHFTLPRSPYTFPVYACYTRLPWLEWEAYLLQGYAFILFDFPKVSTVRVFAIATMSSF